jgi:hypothetical protein
MEKGATKKETGGSSEKDFASTRRLLGTGVAMGVLAMRRVGVADAEASLFGPSTGEYLQRGMTKFRQVNKPTARLQVFNIRTGRL